MRRQEAFGVHGPARIEVSVPSGDVDVRSGDADTVLVTVESSSADDVAITQLGDIISITDERRSRFRGRSLRVVVDVPARSSLEVTTASANVRTTGTLGSVRVRTASGDVDLDDADRVEVSTASGRVNARTVSGDARIRTVSGDITGRTIGRELAASSASGDVRCDHVDGCVEVATTSGDIRIDHVGGEDISIRSVSGDLAVGLPSGIRVEADISTLSGHTALPDPADRHDGGHAASDRRKVRLRLRTVSGDVRVHRSG